MADPWARPKGLPDFKNESALQGFCNDFAELQGISAFKWSSPGNAGVPDMIYIFFGLTIFVEFKHPNGEGVLSELQKETHRELIANGASVYVCDDFDQFREIISHHFKLRPDPRH